MAKVLKPFRFAGDIVHPGDSVEPDAEHLKQLVAAGMVEATKATAHAKPPAKPAAQAAPAKKAKAKAKPAAGLTTASIKKRPSSAPKKLVGQ